MKKLKIHFHLILFFVLFMLKNASAQHDMAGMKGMQMSSDTSMNMQMHSGYSLNLPMNRDGSGTAWLPDASPMYAIMMHSGKWMYMLHGNLAPRFTTQDFTKKGSRGASDFDAPNWFMAMGQRQIGQKGLFHFNVMLSADRFTEGGNGYPLLFQTGESWKNIPLVDRQHPHDLFSELAASYSYSFNKKTDLIFYLGYPGEPALGSTAFMHRPSALSNPDAPIGHHWNDGTHITFGVATIGLRLDKFKIEGSSFTGREPDENRLDFDKPRFDSWSGRLSYNPTQNWALEVSHGFIKSPEMLHSDENVNRTIASAIYSKVINPDQLFNATVLWGLNKYKGHDGENTALLEASYRLRKLELYTRYEWVQKSREELNLDENLYGHDTLFPVNALTLGLNYDLFYIGKFRVAAGGQLSAYHADNRLDNLYGKNPYAGEVFLRIYPSLMKMRM
ncbi:MAG: hypothetical protein EOP42_09055 [Sphingobacteriaceae bacterium]|nr:MAG: hypothetical protein EOP42_09055 [Sphingobacteriaceae bacterium]